MISCFANNVKQAYIYIRGEFPARRAHPGEGASRRRARRISSARTSSAPDYELRNLRPPRRRRLHLRRGDRPDRVARGQARLSAHQAAVFSRRARPLPVPDDREQRRDALPREAHRRRWAARPTRRSARPTTPARASSASAATCRSRATTNSRSAGSPWASCSTRSAAARSPAASSRPSSPAARSAKILRSASASRCKRSGAEMVDYDWGVEDIPMDFDSLAAFGTMGGSGGVIVMDDSRQHGRGARQHQRVLRPRELRPVHALPRRLALDEEDHRPHGPRRRRGRRIRRLLKNVADQIAGRTICAFGEACSWPTQSFLAKFRDEFAGARAKAGAASAPAGIHARGIGRRKGNPDRPTGPQSRLGKSRCSRSNLNLETRKPEKDSGSRGAHRTNHRSGDSRTHRIGARLS